MSTTYTHSNETGNIASKAAIAFLLTAAIFALLPILQILPDLWNRGPKATLVDTAQDFAPIVTEPVPEEPARKEELEKPELEKPVQELTLTQIENILNPGTGGIHGYTIAMNPAGMINIEDDIEIFELSDLDRKPYALFQNQHHIPLHAQAAENRSWVVLEWIITDKGRVTNPRVIKSSHREFQQPTIESILSSKWKPGEIGGQAVNSRVRQKITFSL